MSVKISYGAGPTTLTFKRGPLSFTPYWEARVQDNLATSGKVRERVMASLAPDILISFDMPHLILEDDYAGWAAFMAFALPGSTFQLYPWTLFSDYYSIGCWTRG